MSRIPPPPPETSITSTPIGGSGEQDPQAQLNGVFRLDALSPTGGGDGAQVQLAAPARKVSTQIFVLVGVLLAGGGLLYGMRIMGINPLKSFALAKVPDYDLANVGTDKTAEHLRVLRELQANYTSTQVPLENVQRNPFRMPDGMVVAKATPDDPSPKPVGNSIEAQIQADLRSLKLQGVLEGRVPVARISGEAVRIGDSVGKFFKVTAIQGREVELTASNGKTFLLHLDEADRNSTKHSKP